MSSVLLIQPPFVQLNSPYPAPYYLKTFLEKQGHTVTVEDHSIGLFEEIFNKKGLKKVFSDAEALFYTEKRVKEDIRRIIERFFSEKDKWIASIDRISAFLRGKDYEFAHFICLCNGVLPTGPRFDAFIEKKNGEIALGDAPLAASKLLADIADFITVVLDPNFSLIRYTSSLSGSHFNFFSNAEKMLDGYILREFYKPFLEKQWRKREKTETPNFAGVTIPFTGCLAGALFCAGFAKARFPKITVLAGGGFVNTELRFLKASAFFNYIDYLCFDKGYGALAWVLSGASGSPYKTFFSLNGEVSGDIEENSASPFFQMENEAVQTVFPDYNEVDFSRYLRIADSGNPMRRLWTDGRWLKAYTAYGCYWHSCAFCDVHLDYVKCFRPVDAPALFHRLLAQAEKTGVRGVHLVDEAAPPSSLFVLAELNRAQGLPLRFWGNIRFEKSWTPDAAMILAEGGFIGFSGGLEVVTESGLKRLGKGFELRDAVKTCAAFKEQGLLVHSYLIYGYYDESDQEIADSAELTRQFFQAGLLDSAFWHQFILTRHSRVYRAVFSKNAKKEEGDFALNDLSFSGEERFQKWEIPLDLLLESWMEGVFFEREKGKAGKIPFKTPSLETRGKIAAILDEYARDEVRFLSPQAGSYAVFLGSRPLVRKEERIELFWRYRLRDFFLNFAEISRAEKVKTLLEEAAKPFGVDAPGLYAQLEHILGDTGEKTGEIWRTLRLGGLAVVEKWKDRKICEKREKTS